MHLTNSAFRRCGFDIPGFGIPAPHSAFRCSAFRPVPVYGVCAAVGGLAELVLAGSAKLSGINRNVSYQRLQTVSFATLPVLLEKDKVITVSFKRAESS